MTSWFSRPEEEARATMRAAQRVGAEVRSLEIRPTAFGPRAVADIACADGWHAAKLLLALAIEDSLSPGARDLALAIRRYAPGDADYARAVHEFVRTRVRFVRESGEIFQGPAYTLAAGAGDCDDQFRVVYALFVAGGLAAREALLHKGSAAPPAEQGPAHVLAIVHDGDGWAWAETTIDADFGEHPLTAAARLGVTQGRSDIAKEVVIMSESDLAPVPPGFVDRNGPAQTALDADALQRLGYLAALPADPADPTEMDFRRAILAFQFAVGLHPDGLVGPHTRHAIASQLGHVATDGFALEYARSLGMSGIGDVGAGTALTAHLDDDFFRGLAAMVADFRAKGAKVTGADFLAVWMGESGVKASSKNSLGYAGLNGMGPTERKNAGFTGTLDDWTSLTATEQLPYVRRFYELNVQSFGGGRYGVLTDVGALYLMNFLPAYIGHAGEPDFVLASQANDTHGWYRDNPGLDIGKKGYIEVADMSRWVSRVTSGQAAYYAELRDRLAAVGGDPASGGGMTVASALALTVMASAAAALARFGFV